MADEFLEYGYEKASLNRISAKVGITTAGLYRHFSGKDDMFSCLVQDTIHDFRSLTDSMKDQMSETMNYTPFHQDWTETWTAFIYSHYEGVKLLVCWSAVPPVPGMQVSRKNWSALKPKETWHTRHPCIRPVIFLTGSGVPYLLHTSISFLIPSVTT